jgi:hypothetical protein
VVVLGATVIDELFAPLTGEAVLPDVPMYH